MQKNYFINVTDYKVLLTISYLNELGYIASAQGVLKIISGVIDEETEMFELCPTFQVLVSYNSKKMTRDLNRLVTCGYLKRIHNEELKDYFFEITEKGKVTLSYFGSHHKVNLKKHDINPRVTIIKKDK
ncbi:MAG: hypothetical protein IJQ67_06195 [Bacilli bacterium]|nr:hypothetical protein [Bacilli bacterium]